MHGIVIDDSINFLGQFFREGDNGPIFLRDEWKEQEQIC